MVKLSGGVTLARAMKSCGVDYIFYVTGGMGPSFYEEMENVGLNMILCRNEKAATNMADGYSRVTRRPSICFAQHGAAAAILSSMMYEPMYAHSPVVALTASTETSRKDRWAYQELYEMRYFEETCKFNVDVTDNNRLAEYLRIAVQAAVCGCPGPTHVNMHNDMCETAVEMPPIYGDEVFFRVPPFRPRADAEKVAEAARLLAGSLRPLMICGSGVHISAAYDEVRQLAELLTIPVVTNYGGKGCFPEDHPLYVGVCGSYGMEYANEAIRNADLVFFVAARAGPHMTEEATAPEPGASKIVHLDIDPLVIGRNYKADAALVGDAKVTLQELLATLRVMIKKPTSRDQRLQDIVNAMKEYEKLVESMTRSEAIPIKPQRIMKEVSETLGPRDIVVSDTGQMLCWTTRFLKLRSVGLHYFPCCGTLGSSFGLAMGISFGAAQDQRVLNLIGDGGMGYNLTELETMKRYGDQHTPFVALVNNNSTLGQTRPRLEDWTKKNPPCIASADFSELNYAKIAEAFGCYGVRVERPGELAEAIKNAFDSGKPAIVDVVTDKREYIPIGSTRRTENEPIPGFPSY